MRAAPAALLAIILAHATPALAQLPHIVPVVPPPPAPGTPPPPTPKAALDTMLGALRAAPSEAAAGALEAEIRTAWLNLASPAIRLLLVRGAREVEEGAASDAVDSFDAALDLDSDLVEAWRGRAKARQRLGDPAGAIRDLQEVLRREPRHFAALQDLSRIAESQRDWRGALAAWQKVLDLDPKTPDGKERLRDLERRALGERA